MKCFRKIYFTTPNDSYFVRVLLEKSFSSEFVEGVQALPSHNGQGHKNHSSVGGKASSVSSLCCESVALMMEPLSLELEEV